MSLDVSTSSGTSLRAPAALQKLVETAIERAITERWASRIWGRDTAVWTTDARVAGTIAKRLGWLDAPAHFQEELAEFEGFAAGIREAGFTQAVVCGMGGSSLAPEVLAKSFARSAHGIPVHVLDSTDPAAVNAAEALEENGPSLYLIASKSGTTTESLSFLAYFWERETEQAGRIPVGKRGDSFVAITDPGESVKAIPHSDLFREEFLNTPDVGGRYSALTYVGLVPAALLGLDLGELLGDSALMADRCRADSQSNPGLALGAAMGALAAAGRDKLTLILEPDLAAFGAWTEQLIAESTGKHGTGIVPVDGEPLGAPDVYGQDRVFVRLGRAASAAWRSETDASLDALVAAGHPVIDLPLDDRQWLGGEFFRWEFATAVAGAVLGVNPFDEPNVTESKENTRAVLEAYRHAGHFPAEPILAQDGRLTLIGDAQLRLTAESARATAPAAGTANGASAAGTANAAGTVNGASTANAAATANGAATADAAGTANGAGTAATATTASDVMAELRRHLERTRPNGYLGVHAYVAPTDERTDVLRDIQALLRDRTSHATTLGYGPRFLHSTGQLHKGGPPTGCFLQLVSGHPVDLPIPGHKETFGALIDAQARGDFASLQSHELPVLRVHLSDDPDAGLQELRLALETALGPGEAS